MLTTLWIMSVAAVVAMAAALVGRRAVLEGSARVELERGRWSALACERRAVAAIDAALAGGSIDDGTRTWRTLPRFLFASPLIAGCHIQLEAAGTRLDITAATEEILDDEFTALGLTDRAPALVDALEDWVDSDDVARPAGAERPWYEAARRLPPRNAPLADTRELSRVRGFEELGGLDSVLTTIPGRVSLATAPVPVLMAIPGITRETAEYIVSMRDAGTPINDLLSVVGAVSEASKAALADRYADVVRLTTPDPDAWLIRAFETRGAPPVTVALEWRVTRAGLHCIVAATKSRI